jgi:hypothetical protein
MLTDKLLKFVLFAKRRLQLRDLMQIDILFVVLSVEPSALFVLIVRGAGKALSEIVNAKSFIVLRSAGDHQPLILVLHVENNLELGQEMPIDGSVLLCAIDDIRERHNQKRMLGCVLKVAILGIFKNTRFPDGDIPLTFFFQILIRL